MQYQEGNGSPTVPANNKKEKKKNLIRALAKRKRETKLWRCLILFEYPVFDIYLKYIYIYISLYTSLLYFIFQTEDFILSGISRVGLGRVYWSTILVRIRDSLRPCIS